MGKGRRKRGRKQRKGFSTKRAVMKLLMQNELENRPGLPVFTKTFAKQAVETKYRSMKASAERLACILRHPIRTADNC